MIEAVFTSVGRYIQFRQSNRSHKYIYTPTLLTSSIQWILTPFPNRSLISATLPSSTADNSWASCATENVCVRLVFFFMIRESLDGGSLSAPSYNNSKTYR